MQYKKKKIKQKNVSSDIGEEFYPRIEPGEYQAVCHRIDTGTTFGNRRCLYFRFRLFGGKYDGEDLFMVCLLYSAPIPRRSKYYNQWSIAKGRPPIKGERLSREVFKGKLFKVLVRDTLRKFSNNKTMPSQFQYSVVDSILEPLTGSAKNEKDKTNEDDE